MESFKPLVLVLAGVLIAAMLLSFTNEEPQREYAVVGVSSTRLKIKIDVYYQGYETTIESSPGEKRIDHEKEVTKALNQLGKEGWRVVNEIYEPDHSYKAIRLERIRQ